MVSNRAFSGWLFGFLILVFLFGVGFSAFAKCTDSDGGQSLSKKGTITGVLTNGTEYSYEDFCKSDSNDKVVEFVCKPSGFASAVWKCTDGKVCKKGACVQEEPKEEPKATCTDSDGGVNLDKKGTVSGTALDETPYSYSDICSLDGTLNEYICTPTGYQSTKISCDEGKTCKSGACVAQTCTDSDGADNFDVKGKVSGAYSNGKEYLMEDYCLSETKAIDFRCSDDDKDLPDSANQECGEGKLCKDGACVKKEESTKCTDSDGGKKYYKKGTATIPGVTTSTDSCNDDGFLNEIYCYSDKVLSSEKFTCPSGYKCSDGACVKKSMSSSVPKSVPLVAVDVSVSTKTTCVDTDGWGDKNKKGTTTIYNADGSVKASASDSCVDPYTVNEGECKKDGSDWIYTPTKCPATCKDGACWKNEFISTKCVDSDGGKKTSIKGAATSTTTYSNGTSESKSKEDSCSLEGTININEIYCSSNGNLMILKTKCSGGSVCTNGACKGGSASTAGDKSDALKKTKLREFLLASGIETENGVPTFLKSWRINTGTLLDNIFQSGDE